MKLFKNKYDCCGCSACANICPKNAIIMVEDEEGFLYPEIDGEKCINCGLCNKVCSFQIGYRPNNLISAYGLIHKDYETRATSRSGGAFILISDFILESDGAVYGAAFNEDFSVHHKRALNRQDRDEFKGSKYVQSEIGNCFEQVKNDLIRGRIVMFSGTACQVAGLYSFLHQQKIDISKLYTVDLVCHGVPSNKIWKEFLDFILIKSKGKKITSANFRDKSIGWSPHFESVCIDGKKIYSSYFSKLFYKNVILRPSCYNCKYSNHNRPADFTLADFWGVDEYIQDLNDNKGVSLLLVNSDKAKILFDLVKDNSIYHEVHLEGYMANPNLRHPTEKPQDRDEFWKLYYKKGFKKTMKIYLIKIYCGKFINKLRRIIKK